MSAHIRLLPMSPLKMNILQNNSSIVNNANQNLLKVNQTITAKADSTHDHNSSSQRPPVAIDPKTGVPFKKHHHSVKKFQTPSVSRRNARERNRVKQVREQLNMTSCKFMKFKFPPPPPPYHKIVLLHTSLDPNVTNLPMPLPPIPPSCR
jgi:hypothetical protein